MLVPPSFCCTAVQPRWPLATSPNSQPALPLEMLRYSQELLMPDLGQHSVDGRNLQKISWSAFQTTIYKHLCFMYTVIFTKHKLNFIRNSRQLHGPFTSRANRQVLPSPYSKICRPSRPCSSCCVESSRWVTHTHTHTCHLTHNTNGGYTQPNSCYLFFGWSWTSHLAIWVAMVKQLINVSIKCCRILSTIMNSIRGKLPLW